MIAILDYGRGNLFSIERALGAVGGDCRITSEPRELAAATAIILPGVGAFGDAMVGLRQRGLITPLREAARRGTPLLGICLGMQLLFDGSSEFGSHEGLGLIPGRVARLPEVAKSAQGGQRIPNVGWRRLGRRRDSALLSRCAADAMFYFVHSYVPEPASDGDVTGTLDFNGREVAVLVERGKIFGCQFHPEKSGPEGLKLLRRVLETANSEAAPKRASA